MTAMIDGVVMVIWCCVVAAGALVLWNLRPQQVDKHPRCRRCGYDLSGMPATSDRCSECGADVRARGAIVVGRRQRNWKPALLLGALAIALGLGVRALEDYQTAWRNRPQELSNAVSENDLARVQAMLAQYPDLSRPEAYGRWWCDPFQNVVPCGSVSLLKTLLQAYPTYDVNQRQSGGGTLLRQAVLKGDLAMVTALVQAGADVDLASRDEERPLQAAVRRGYEKMVPVLLQLGADPKVVDARGRSLLHDAVWARDVAVIKQILAAGVAVDVRDGEGRTPLHDAVRLNRDASAYALLMAGADLGAKDKEGRRPSQVGEPERRGQVMSFLRDRVYTAAEAGDLASVEKWLKSEPDLVGSTGSQGTLLHLAAERGMAPLAGVLLKHGADVNALDEFGQTALAHAVASHKEDLVTQLLHAGADVNVGEIKPIHRAAERGRLIDVLQKAGADLHARDKHGATVLHWALMHSANEPAVVRDLLKRGVQPDVYLTLATGATEAVREALEQNPGLARDQARAALAMLIAIRWGRTDVVELLAEEGADLDALIAGNQPNQHQGTPLHWAYSYGQTKVARVLVECGADVNRAGALGETPLHWAVWRSAEDVKFLLDRGARVNAADGRGETALHKAARRDVDPKMIEVLLAAGASKDARDKWGRIPADYATGNQHGKRIRELLGERGVE